MALFLDTPSGFSEAKRLLLRKHEVEEKVWRLSICLGKLSFLPILVVVVADPVSLVLTDTEVKKTKDILIQFLF